MASSTIKSIITLRDELHEKLLSYPDYRALLALDRLIGEIETDFGTDYDEAPTTQQSNESDRIVIAENDVSQSFS